MQTRYETHHQAGMQIAPHRHEFAYAALVLDGAYEEAGPDGAWGCEQGDLIVHPPFHLHLNRFPYGDARVLNFELPHALARAIGADRYCVFRVCDPGRIAACREPRDAIAEAFAACEAKTPERSADWLDQMARALAGEPPPSIASLSRQAGFTPEYAARAFRKRFGMSPAAFRGEQRLRRALARLATSGQPLAEIAQSEGFADQAHFSRRVRQATGRTPSALRRLLS